VPAPTSRESDGLHVAAFASREVEFSIGSAPQVRSGFVQQVNRAEASRWQRLRFLWELAISEAEKEKRRFAA